MRHAKPLSSISEPSTSRHTLWSDFLIFRNTTSNVAVNRAAGDFHRHHHEFAEIIFVTTGSATHWMDGVRHPIERGEFVIAAPGAEHEYSHSSSFSRVNLQIRACCFNELRGSLRKSGLCVDALEGRYPVLREKGKLAMPSPGEFQEWLRIVKEMEREWVEQPAGGNLAVEFLLGVLLVRLLRVSHAPDGEEAEDANLLKSVIRHIDEHYMTTITMAELARIGHMSVRTMERRVREMTGFSPKQYLMRTRIDWARRRLSLEGWTDVKAVAASCGFPDQNYFARAFKKAVGVAPSSYKAVEKRWSSAGVNNSSV